ncbi:YdcF family protein [Kineococcus sp. SYSU DK003]|uniref:YdcF family protein n=1 Tax=Kineococcus sp. SYSU DK003 TaxID=3383124 RepID=UPI003D7E4921
MELVHRVAASAGFPGSRRGEPDVVLVLGNPSRRNGSLHPVQRWRTEIAARTSSTAVLVFSGYARGRGPSEAAVMAAYAHDALGVAAQRIRREESARSTWENVALSLADLDGAQRIAIASSPLHALRARRYLARQRPDLAARLVPAADYRAGERWGWKAASLLYDVARSLRLRV